MCEALRSLQTSDTLSAMFSMHSVMVGQYLFFFFFIFSHFYVGSMCLVRRLHLDRSCASSSDNPLSDKSLLMLSIHLRFGLPLLLFPGTSIPNTLFPTYSSSLLETCPYHFNLLSCTFLDISPTFVFPLILSFLILSILVTPLIHLNILISATSNFFSCAFFTAHVSAPYIIAGLTTVLYTFPWSVNTCYTIMCAMTTNLTGVTGLRIIVHDNKMFAVMKLVVGRA